ncbi:MAG TPA: magnesium transporter CorA family protein [Candidatus Paceibacterota bacterium]|nr:magnesium transporter CorA family protein [Candidatus Paceibacterota bacterium]
MTTTRRSHDSLTWIDLENPSREEVAGIAEEFALDAVVAEEILSPARKPRIELFDDYFFLILHFPALRHSHSTTTLQEIDFVVGKEFLITVRYDSVDAIDKFGRVFDVGVILKHSPEGDHAGYLFYFLVQKLYHSLGHELEYIESALESIEGRIFDGGEHAMVRELSFYGRDLADIVKAIGYHEDVLASLEVAGEKLFGSGFRFYLHRVLGEYRRIRHQLGSAQHFFSELRETNNSLLSTKQNEVMKTLTIMAFVTFPLTLIAALFGMNTVGTPILGHHADFWIIIVVMLLLSLVMFSYFKYKRWL